MAAAGVEELHHCSQGGLGHAVKNHLGAGFNNSGKIRKHQDAHFGIVAADHLLDNVGEPGTEGEEDALVDPDQAAVLSQENSWPATRGRRKSYSNSVLEQEEALKSAPERPVGDLCGWQS